MKKQGKQIVWRVRILIPKKFGIGFIFRSANPKGYKFAWVRYQWNPDFHGTNIGDWAFSVRKFTQLLNSYSFDI